MPDIYILNKTKNYFLITDILINLKKYFTYVRNFLPAL